MNQTVKILADCKVGGRAFRKAEKVDVDVDTFRALVHARLAVPCGSGHRNILTADNYAADMRTRRYG